MRDQAGLLTNLRRAVLSSATGPVLGAVLVAATFIVLGLSFRFGVARGHDTTIAVRGTGHFEQSVCAILSRTGHGTGRYVCAAGAEQSMRAAGLGFDEATLERAGQTLAEARRDAARLNDALRWLFQAPRLPSGDAPVIAIGWGQDAGYSDFVDVAFRVFGRRVESLYRMFFALLAVSTALLCIQFFGRPFVLFAVLAFHQALFVSMSRLDWWELDAVNNPRVLSLLAIPPLLHAAFSMVEGVRPSPRAIALFLPQAALMVAAAHVRATAYWSVIALALGGAVLAGVAWWRRERPLRASLLRAWPALTVFACLAAALLLVAGATDTRLASIGGMRGHAFWQPLYYNLQLHPDWKAKYAAQHEGATGDATAWVAVASYLRRHPGLDRRRDYLYGDRARGLTQIAYEKYTRAAYLEFVRNDPWYVAELKYENAANMARIVRREALSACASLGAPFLALTSWVVVALVVQIRQGRERLSALTRWMATLAASTLLAAGPIWATVVVLDSMLDTYLLAITTVVAAAVWGAVWLGVLATRRGARPGS